MKLIHNAYLHKTPIKFDFVTFLKLCPFIMLYATKGIICVSIYMILNDKLTDWIMVNGTLT